MKTILATITIAFALCLVALPAAATTATECHSLIDVARGDLAGVEIGGGNPDRTRASLDSKLDGADTKLDQFKPYDALQKLTDFQASVEKLTQGKPKISGEDAALLSGDAADAIACVQALIDGM